MKNNKTFNAIEFNNIKEIIYHSAKEYSENIAFVIKHKENQKVTYENVTYKRLLEDINKLGTSFYNMGFKGKRIAIIGKNRYEWALTHLTNLLGGIVSVPLDKDLQYDELENSLIRSKADCIVFDEKLKDDISKIKKAGNTNLSEFICMTETEGYRSIGELIREGKEIVDNGERDYIDNKINDDEMAILLFTSGTTAKSKAVMLSQKNIASNVYGMQLIEDIRETDVNIAFLPFHHIFGSTIILTVALTYGVKTVFPDGLRYIKQNLNEYKVTIFVGVPILIEAIYKSIMKEIEKQGKTKIIKFAKVVSNILLKLGIDIRRKIFKQIIAGLGGELRMIISGGAPGDSKVIKEFNEFGIDVLQGYGLSETSPVIAVEGYKRMKNGSVGKPLMNETVEIVDKDENGIGEIRVKGPNVMLGYYEMPEITNEVFKDGWFYTGDLGYIDKEGFLYITGRTKSLIVLKNGKKVFPEELETLINRIELVSESMVFGMPDKDNPNDVKLSVKIVYDNEVIKEKYLGKSKEEIYKIIWNEIKELNKTFPKYKHIQNMIITDKELIKTTTKKVKRQEEMKVILGNNN